MQSAPLYADVADGPPGGQAFWCRTEDGVRIRLGVWPNGPHRSHGTVLLLPGRSEYVEKYGRLARDLARHGLALLAVDFRGQGLADRLLADRNIGHVGRFTDYQFDVAAALQAARALGLPEPFFLLAHSMGGCIGLRALVGGLAVRAAAFSAPMWGMNLNPALRLVVSTLAKLARLSGLAARYAPGTGPVSYVISAPFADNVLTSDPDMFAYMQAQVRTHPELGLGGPSLNWLHEALGEMRYLRSAPLPGLPVLTAIGQCERVIDPGAVHAMMARWPAARFQLIEGSEHEMIMETPAIRARFLQAALQVFGL